MRIISKFKDYYDHIAHQYGGGDPKIVYERKELTEPKIIQPGNVKFYEPIYHSLQSELVIPHAFGLHGHSYDYSRHGKFAEYTGSYVCVAGRMFLLIQSPQTELTYYKNVPGAAEHVSGYHSYRNTPVREQFDGAVEYPELVKLCQMVKAPVFLFRMRMSPSDGAIGKRTFTILCEVPMLSKLGLARYYPPANVYQDLSYFMGNTINGSPDIDPPAVVSDKDRLLQRGFDLKTSFRGKQ